MNLILIAKLKSKTVIDEATGCWLYQGARISSGYGSYKHQLVHRLSYTEFFGPPKGYILHKLECRNKNCWNPEHLYDGTPSDNVCDLHMTKPGYNKKTHCIRGHELTPENIVSGKNCRQCNAIRKQNWKARQ